MAKLNGRVAAARFADYKLSMFVLAFRRLWRAMIVPGFLLATAMPALAAYHPQAAVAPCSGGQMARESVLDCSGQAPKAMPCGAVACMVQAIKVAERVMAVEHVALPITFPLTRPPLMAGATLIPDPFPPKARPFM